MQDVPVDIFSAGNTQTRVTLTGSNDVPESGANNVGFNSTRGQPSEKQYYRTERPAPGQGVLRFVEAVEITPTACTYIRKTLPLWRSNFDRPFGAAVLFVDPKSSSRQGPQRPRVGAL